MLCLLVLGVVVVEIVGVEVVDVLVGKLRLNLFFVLDVGVVDEKEKFFKEFGVVDVCVVVVGVELKNFFFNYRKFLSFLK